MAKGSVPPKSAAALPALTVLATGVPGFDDVLGGGLPAHSFNVVAGGPGSGKTTLVMQMLFANATIERPGLFITLLGETSLKMLRYQQLFGFFDRRRVGVDVHFLNLSEEALAGDLEGVLARITEHVERLTPLMVVVDSFRSLTHIHNGDEGTERLEGFVQRLAMHLATWEITSFLIGEYTPQESHEPIFTIADGVFWMSQETNRNSVVRRLQVVKTRGMPTMPGLHTFRMSRSGVQVFPRTPEQPQTAVTVTPARLSTGVPGLDEMMGGGIPAGDSLVLAGPTGSGKTTFAMRCVAAGLAVGEAAVIAIFEEHPEKYLQRSRALEVDLRAAITVGKLRIIYLRPLDLSVDETLDEIRTAVKQLGATRVVIDSISGFEMALAPTFREDFRESLYRLINALTGLGVTMYSTVEVVDGAAEGQGGLKLTGYQISFLTDDIVSLRYVELEGELRKVLTVTKMRGSNHSREFRTYELAASGVRLGESLRDYDGILSGMPTRQARVPLQTRPGLTTEEANLFAFLQSSGPRTTRELVKQLGVSAKSLDPAIGRLLQLQYVIWQGEKLVADLGPRTL